MRGPKTVLNMKQVAETGRIKMVLLPGDMIGVMYLMTHRVWQRKLEVVTGLVHQGLNVDKVVKEYHLHEFIEQYNRFLSIIIFIILICITNQTAILL